MEHLKGMTVNKQHLIKSILYLQKGIDPIFYSDIQEEVYQQKDSRTWTTLINNAVAMRLCAERNQDLRRYNLLAADEEVAVIIPGDGSEEHSDHCDIILRLRGGLKRISHLNPAYSTIQYPLLFPCGEDGWHIDIPAHVPAGRRM